MTITLRHWNKLLWDHLEAELHQTSKRIYLTFHNEILLDIYSNAYDETSEPSVIETFHKLCKSCFIPRHSSNHILLDNNCLKAKEGEHSLALSLAVQQILIAEEMLDGQFFPLYIKKIGSPVRTMGRNPFYSNGFERIWHKLKNEMLEHLDCSETQITFHAGIGINKNRQYPFSQSLLSLKELDCLAKVAFRIKGNIHDIYSTKRLIRNNPNCLTARSKRKRNGQGFLDACASQLISYWKEIDINEFLSEEPKKTNLSKNPQIHEGRGNFFEPTEYFMSINNIRLFTGSLFVQDKFVNSVFNKITLKNLLGGDYDNASIISLLSEDIFGELVTEPPDVRVVAHILIHKGRRRNTHAEI